ncbi:hypothetical protein EDC01DRAFT_29856 [Geopyxis carbonaria]|nr:hypothetical protein EDC01DRAFT_29856 [Geopyxis carbonaria]
MPSRSRNPSCSEKLLWEVPFWTSKIRLPSCRFSLLVRTLLSPITPLHSYTHSNLDTPQSIASSPTVASTMDLDAYISVMSSSSLASLLADNEVLFNEMFPTGNGRPISTDSFRTVSVDDPLVRFLAATPGDSFDTFVTSTTSSSDDSSSTASSTTTSTSISRTSTSSTSSSTAFPTPPALATSTLTPPTSPSPNPMTIRLIIIFSILGALLLGCGIIGLFWCRSRRRQNAARQKAAAAPRFGGVGVQAVYSPLPQGTPGSPVSPLLPKTPARSPLYPQLPVGSPLYPFVPPRRPVQDPASSGRSRGSGPGVGELDGWEPRNGAEELDGRGVQAHGRGSEPGNGAWGGEMDGSGRMPVGHHGGAELEGRRW